MKTPKILTALLLGSAMLLSGCGAKEAADQPTPETDNTPAVEDEASTELSGELNYWSMWNDTEPQGEVWQHIADGFMEKYPNVKVNIQWCGRDNKKILKPAFEGGETIDVFEYPFEIDLNEYVLDQTPYLDKVYDEATGKSIKDVLLPSLLTTPQQMTGMEGTPAVGYKPWISLFMYNASIFEEAGVTSEPKTWAELDAACAKIKEAGYVPLTFDDAYASWLPGMYLAREKGQDWVRELVQDTTGEMWKDEAVVKMAKAFEDFAAKGYFDANVGGNKWPAGQVDVGSGKVAMYYNLTGLPTEVKDITGDDFKWGGFSFPDVVEGGNRATVEDPYGCTLLAVSKNTANPDLAMAFVNYALSVENDAYFVEHAGITPATTETEWPASLANTKARFESVQVALKSGGDIGSNPDLAPTISENFIKLAAGEITADDFVANMVKATTK